MRPQGNRLVVLRAELFRDQICPEKTRRAHFGDFHEGVHADRPEKGQTRRELVDIETCSDTGADVFDTVGNRVGELKVSRSACFLHVIAGNRDRVVTRHMLRSITKNVGDDPHAWTWWIDIGVADHELFQNVILNGSGQLRLVHALFFCSDDIKRQNRQNRPIHRHGDGHLVQRNPREQRTHVIDGVDRHTGHADITHHARVV